MKITIKTNFSYLVINNFSSIQLSTKIYKPKSKVYPLNIISFRDCQSSPEFVSLCCLANWVTSAQMQFKIECQLVCVCVCSAAAKHLQQQQQHRLHSSNIAGTAATSPLSSSCHSQAFTVSDCSGAKWQALALSRRPLYISDAFSLQLLISAAFASAFGFVPNLLWL